MSLPEIACAAMTDKILVLGSCHGSLHVLDHALNEVKCFDRLHTGKINQVSIDECGEHAASCGDDKSVTVTNLYDGSSSKFGFQQPIESVSINPMYPNNKSFVAGGFDGEVLFKSVTSSWIWSTKDVVLSSGGGTVLDVRWKGEYVAWVSYEFGVKIMNVVTKQMVPTLERKQQECRNLPWGCRAHLVWQNETTLLSAVGNRVKLYVIRELNSREAEMQEFIAQELEQARISTGMKYTDVVSVIETRYEYICGIAPCGTDVFVVLGTEKPRHPPVLEIMSWSKRVLHSEPLSQLSGYERLRPGDYKLVSFCSGGEDSLYYVVTPREVLVTNVRWHTGHCQVLGVTKTIFEAVLNSLAASDDVDDRKKMLKYLREWPPNCYSRASVACFLEVQLRNCKCRCLQEGLRELYVLQGRFEDAVNLYLELQDQCVFQFIEQRELHCCLPGRLAGFLRVSRARTMYLLVHAREVIPVSQVVSELREISLEVVDEYLWKIFKEDSEIGKEFHQWQLELHAEYRPSCVVEFLKKSRHWEFDRTYEVCQSKGIVPAVAFLLASKGKNKDVVKLMIGNFGRILQLMDVVSEFNGVWEVLVSKAKQDEKLMEAVLKHSVGKMHMKKSLSGKEKVKVYTEEENKVESNVVDSGASKSGVEDDMESFMDDVWFFNSVLKQEVEKKNPIVAR